MEESESCAAQFVVINVTFVNLSIMMKSAKKIHCLFHFFTSRI